MSKENQNTEQRYFLDIRSGCAAVRDSKHPNYDNDYPGLHHDTIDVIEYRHGYQSKYGWQMNPNDIQYLTDLCNKLNEKSTTMSKEFNKKDYDNYNKILDEVGYGNSYKAAKIYSDQQNTLLQEQFEDLKRQNLELQEKLAEKEKELSEVKLNIKYAIESINDFQDGGCSKNIKDAKYFLNLTPPSKR